MQKTQMFRSIIIDVVSPNTNVAQAERNLIELKSLIKTYGSIDVGHIIQHRTKPDKDTFIGSGKLQELIEMVANKKIDILILNDIVKPTQLFHITERLWVANPDIKVWDRVDLILHIFEKHAQTTEARLQIEIARMHHMGPRIYGLGGTYFSRQGGGIGSKGVGGKTAIRIASKKTFPLSGLIIVDPSGLPHTSFVTQTKINIAKTVKPIMDLPFMKGIRSNLLRLSGSDDYIAHPELKETFINIIREHIEFDLPKIEDRTLIIWGGKDENSYSPVSDVEVYKRLIPHADVHIIQDAGHYCFIDNANEFYEAVLTFLK